MLRLFRIVRGHKYYKQIAKLVGADIYQANQDIPEIEGQCVLFDQKKSNPKTIPFPEARQQAKLQGLDLILLKQDTIPILQLKPYIYTIYKQFYRKAGGKKGLGVKSIPISNRIMDHDLTTKKMIVNQLLKKGHYQFNLIGTNSSDQNRLMIQKFCSLMQWPPSAYHFSVATRGTGKITMDYWICHVNCGDVKIRLNYQSLDKKYLNLKREQEKTGSIRWKSEHEEEDYDEQVEEGELYEEKTPIGRFEEMMRRGEEREKKDQQKSAKNNMAKGVGIEEEGRQPQEDVKEQARRIIRQFNAQSDQDLEQEIHQLEEKANLITDIEYKRLLKLRNEWKARRRILQ